MPEYFHELPLESAPLFPHREALVYQGERLNYLALATHIRRFGQRLLDLGLSPLDRVGIFLEKRIETVCSLFSCSLAGGVFVPINPALKADQVSHILNDCGIRFLITSQSRLAALGATLEHCPTLETLILVDEPSADTQLIARQPRVPYDEASTPPLLDSHATLPTNMVAILYTSGSTGKPKGVVLSHQNLVLGAKSVARYLELTQHDRLLCALPLSFDYGLNQVNTAFLSGACAVLLNYLMPHDVLRRIDAEQITGLAAVPPLWIQLAQLSWPASCSLRYFTNSGGALPQQTLNQLRVKLPNASPYLMYGLTEAFRSTFLPPSEIDRRPGSMGKAIPYAEILVVREDGTPCAPHEPGELVHRGPLVSLGYWNDASKTAERFKLSPTTPAPLQLPEYAVWSGDTVKMDDDGFLYFVGRRDDMIKTSGYRVSPTEIEEVIYATGLVDEVVALGIPHPMLGQAILLVIVPLQSHETLDISHLKSLCQQKLPSFMVPQQIEIAQQTPLPRNNNGKFDRRLIASWYSSSS